MATINKKAKLRHGKEVQRKISRKATSQKSSRYDSSLGLLTKKFMGLVKESGNGIVDLNVAAEVLQVQKRRVYDITNVLEGIGMIKKETKNHIRWNGSKASATVEKQDAAESLENEMKSLKNQEGQLEHYIRHMQTVVHMALRENSRHTYTQLADMADLPCFKNQTLIAVNAPAGSSLEVPDPDEEMPPGQRRYQIFLKSQRSPMEVYLINAKQDQESVQYEPNASVASSLPSTSLNSIYSPTYPANAGIPILPSPNTMNSSFGSFPHNGKRKLNCVNRTNELDENFPPQSYISEGVASVASGSFSKHHVHKLSPVMADDEILALMNDNVGVSEYFLESGDGDILALDNSGSFQAVSPLNSIQNCSQGKQF